MKMTVLALLVLALIPFYAFAIDGQILINTSTVMAAGGFPYTITEPGSYKLSGNLTVSTAANGIDINSDDVTLDLNGFTISCAIQACQIPYVGVFSSGHLDITVKNGSVRGFGNGVLLLGSGLISDLKATGNFGTGIAVEGSGASDIGGFVITRCIANSNTFGGIAAYQSTVSDSTANFNYEGLRGGQSAFFNNVANNNTAYGLVTEADLYGGNNFQGNPTAVGVFFVAGVSQNNNNCNGSVC
jgi:hypothetical protein